MERIKVMKNKFNLFLLLIMLLLVGCKSKDKPNYVIKSYQYYSYLDTVSEIKLKFDKNKTSIEKMKENMQNVNNILLDIEKNFSKSQTIQMKFAGIAESITMQVNKNSGELDENEDLKFTKVNKEFIELTKTSIELSKTLNGSFDITIGPLSSLWNISGQVGNTNPTIPTNEQIKENLKLIDYNNIVIDEENCAIALKEKNMQIDFGAIAKGYAADKVLEYIKTLNVEVALINLGGNIYSYGNSTTEPVTISIRNPFYKYDSNEPYTVITTPLTNISAVTSGTYERYITLDDVTYHHLLNPKTGYPFDNEIVSVTIFGTSSTFCDGLATGIYGMGLTEGIKKIKELENYQAVFITKDKKIYIVGNLEYTKTANDFEIIK